MKKLYTAIIGSAPAMDFIVAAQPPRMSEEEKRLAWTWHNQGKTQIEIAAFCSGLVKLGVDRNARPSLSIASAWPLYSDCTVTAQ